MSDTTLPLLRFHDAASVVAWHRGNPISLECFLGEVSALAEQVPPRRFAINLCESRYRFAVAFCAAMVRGQISLLPHNRSLKVLAEVAARYPNHYFLDDDGFRAGQKTRLAAAGRDAWVDCEPAEDRAVTPSKLVPHIPADRTAAIVFTSGSTGRPRAHAKSWNALIAVADLQRNHLRCAHGGLSGILATVPPQHMYGLEASIMLPLQSGLPLHDGRPLFPEDVRHTLAVCGTAPLMVTTPIHLEALVRAGLRYPTCGLVLSATAPLDRESAALAEQYFGCQVHDVYGSTETGAVASRRTVVDRRWKPYPGVRLVNDGIESTRVLADHLPVPIPLMDHVELGDDGCFDLFGRLDDTLSIAGKRASLGDLNKRLLAIPGVDDGVVFLLDSSPGSPPRLGAMVVAPGLDAATIGATLRQSVDPVFLPRKILIADELPRSDTGEDLELTQGNACK